MGVPFVCGNWYANFSLWVISYCQGSSISLSYWSAFSHFTMEQQGYMRRIRVCLYEPETQNSLLPLLPVIVSFRLIHYADFSAKGQIVPNQSCFCYVLSTQIYFASKGSKKAVFKSLGQWGFPFTRVKHLF